MPSMAMEPLGASRSGSLAFASFRSAGASSSGSRYESYAARERRLASELQEADDRLRRSLVSKASAVCRIAELMSSQNELMLAGVRSSAAARPPARAAPVGFVARTLIVTLTPTLTSTLTRPGGLCGAEHPRRARGPQPDEQEGAGEARPRPGPRLRDRAPSGRCRLRRATEASGRGAACSGRGRWGADRRRACPCGARRDSARRAGLRLRAFDARAALGVRRPAEGVLSAPPPPCTALQHFASPFLPQKWQYLGAADSDSDCLSVCLGTTMRTADLGRQRAVLAGGS